MYFGLHITVNCLHSCLSQSSLRCFWAVCGLLRLACIHSNSLLHICKFPYCRTLANFGNDTGSKDSVLVTLYKMCHTHRHPWLHCVEQCYNLSTVYVSITTCGTRAAGKVQLLQRLRHSFCDAGEVGFHIQ